MRILLSNDDGIDAQGLHILGRAFAEIGDIYVAAPLQEQSGTGHGITTRKPLTLHVRELPFATQAWAIDGLPADCVKLGIEEMLGGERPDLVISGINNGANMGNDLLYSGTVSAAMEGFLYSVPALAVSVTERTGNFEVAANFARDFYLAQQQKLSDRATFFNINVPGYAPEEVQGWRYTSMGWRWYEDVFERSQGPQGQPYYWMRGRKIDRKTDGNTDVETCAAGYISVTPVQYDLTNYAVLRQLRAEL